MKPPWWRRDSITFAANRRGVSLRFHLRVDEDGPAILIAGASEALLLSPAGAAAAKGLLEGRTSQDVERSLPVVNASQVVEDVRHALEDLGHWDVRYPIFNLVDPALYERPWRIERSVPGRSGRCRRDLDQLRSWTSCGKRAIPHVRLITTPRTDQALAGQGGHSRRGLGHDLRRADASRQMAG